MDYKKYIDNFGDFPKKGVQFKDISSLIAQPDVFDSLIKEMAEKVSSWEFDTIVALDARGFVFGSALAFYLNKRLVMARKAGKLPGKVSTTKYDLEYGSATIEVQTDKVAHRKVLIVDDVLATGGTVNATIKSIRDADGFVVGVLTAMELSELEGREYIGVIPVMSVVKY